MTLNGTQRCLAAVSRALENELPAAGGAGPRRGAPGRIQNSARKLAKASSRLVSTFQKNETFRGLQALLVVLAFTQNFHDAIQHCIRISEKYEKY
jgi:hypothetical protein